jgi:hypothetical protein
VQLDEGNIGSTSLALSPDARTLASGSSSGVVNVYRRPQGLSLLEKLDTSSWQSTLLSDGAMQGSRRSSTAMPLAPDSTPPARALMNLATAVDTLAFSGDGQVGLCGVLDVLFLDLDFCSGRGRQGQSGGNWIAVLCAMALGHICAGILHLVVISAGFGLLQT